MAAPHDIARELPVPGTWAYLDRLDVEAGTSVDVHASAPAAHVIELLRLGRRAVLDPGKGIADDRAEATVLASVERPATPRTISPGSFVRVGGDALPSGPLSLGLWVRPWRLPVVDVVQAAWQGLMTEIDYPDRARFGFLFDHLGRIGLYWGDGGGFRHEWLHMGPPVFAKRLGEWRHVVATADPARGLTIHVDGEAVLDVPGPLPAASATGVPLRIGAMGEHGAAADLLEADIALPFIGSFRLDAADVARIHAARGRLKRSDLPAHGLLGFWPLDEEGGAALRDASGAGRDGTIVNHGTWMVGGPDFDAADRKPLEYDPAADPDRGHGLRLCSDDLMDAGWPVSATFDIPADAPSGIYAVRVRLAGQADEHALETAFVVTRRRPRKAGAIAVLAATNTWHAYGRRPTNELAVYGLTSTYYSIHLNGRPFFHLGMRLPLPYATPFGFESKRAAATGSTHLVRTERHLEAWLDREGYAFEFVTDLDLHREPGLLSHFAALAIVGHSEYWSNEARQGVLDYLAAGGKVVSLSGDTLSVRVTFDADMSVMECRKIVYEEDARWLAPPLWGESWHSQDGMPGGTYRRLGMAPYDVLGMSFKGMIDDGTPTAFASYVLLDPDHFLVKGPHPVLPDSEGRIGLRSLNGSGGASGYEFDANLDRTRLGDAPLPGVSTIASATGQRNIEWLGERDHGADLIHWRRPAGGEVVNFGSIAAAGALPVDEAFANLMRNTLHHFGIARTDGAGR